MVGAQLVRCSGELYYWREGDDEVDFVYKHGRHVYGIEVKSGRRKKENGLLKFKKKFPKAILIMITLENYINFEHNPELFLEQHSY